MTSHNAQSIVTDIKQLIQEAGNRSVPILRPIRREFSKRLAMSEPQFVVALALQLLDELDDPYRFFAYELVHYHKATLRSLDEPTLDRLGEGMDNWGAGDTFGCYLSGPAWREHQISDDVIHRWAHSDDRWWRRAALVSTVPLNLKARGGTGDTPRTLEVCALLASDSDDMVIKALSWSLRELCKHDAEAVSEFLEEHDSVLAARVKREVRNKLTTGLKNPRA